MKDIRKNIARNILYYRKKLSLTQKELADRLGVRNSAVSNWEKKQNSPDIDTLFDMCKLFDISITEMAGVSTSNLSEKYTPDEQQLIDDYRTLNDQGKEHIRICMASAQALFKENSADISSLESKSS